MESFTIIFGHARFANNSFIKGGEPRQHIEQHVPNPKGLVSSAVVPPKVATPNDKVHGLDDGVEGGDVLIIRMIKKEQQAMQCKACQTIMAKVRKMAIKKKNKGLKPFLVTCDSSRKPKPPHINIWINMLHGYCGVLDLNIDNINAQPHVLMNIVKNRLEDQWEYVGYDLSYQEFKAQMNVYLNNR
jgi:hypothetical protein